MIDLNTRRKFPAERLFIQNEELESIDLSTVKYLDVLGKVGIVDFATAGFLNECGRHGLQLRFRPQPANTDRCPYVNPYVGRHEQCSLVRDHAGQHHGAHNSRW